MLGRSSWFAFGSILLAALVGGVACSDDDGGGGSGGAGVQGGTGPQGGTAPKGGATHGGSANGGKAGGANAGGTSARGGSSALGGVVGIGGEGGHGGASGSENGGSAGREPEGGAGGDGGAGPSSPLEVTRASYRNFSQRTAEPEAISAEIFGLCRSPTLLETEFTKSVHGKELYLLDWLNAEAAAGYAQAGSAPFPVGAAIVKEKLVRNGTQFDVAALGIMIKRAPGFDSLRGDWEFGYWEPESGMTSDPAYCGNCHANAATDFVFVDDSWRIQRP